ncbi:MAG: hypothetical protein K2I75_03895, partial [Clostridiales bacterium]|nr:hypothetical protein [Clostridiales bacterium]
MDFNDAARRAFVSVKIRFFQKTDGVFVEVPTTTDISTCEYWAIEIEDKHAEGARTAIQIALSVKDSHHGKKLYTAPDKANVSAVAHSSERKLLNFYYDYRQPGILAMHTYYRTDGNAESKVAIDGQPGKYLVDQSVITTADFDESETELIAEYAAAATTAARKQEILGVVKFNDEFKYKYFERTYEQVENGTTTTYLTSKRYSARESSFKNYAPIEVKDSLTGVKVPMSFIALPKGVGRETENGTHVTFANAGNTLSGGNELLDSQYASWNTAAQLALVYKDITVSDGVNTYSVENNPYINIKYIAGPSVTFAAEYVNDIRFKLSEEGNSQTPLASPDQPINYREDKYGFEISKKTGGKRAPGLLKLTIALKTVVCGSGATVGGSDESAVEMVDVEVNLLDYS